MMKTMDWIDELELNLRLFDDTVTQTTELAGLSAEMKTFYADRLIDLAEPKLVYNQFGDEYDIPQGGGKTIEMRMYDSLEKALTPLVEGVTPKGNSIQVTTLLATIGQYGDWTRLSDILQMTAIDNNVLQVSKRHGSQAGRTLDSLTRDVLMGGTSVFYAPKLAGGTETPVLSRYELDATAPLSPDLILQGSAELAAMNAEKIGDSYVAIIHPYAKYDLMKSDLWLQMNQYTAEKWFNGEIGKIGDVRFVETSEAKIWRGEDLSAGARNLKVRTAISAGTTNVAVIEALTAGDAAALAGRKVLIKGVQYTVASATAGGAGAASITLTTQISSAAVNDLIYPGEGGAEGSAVFGTLMLGANAFGRTKIQGGGLEHIVKQLGYGDDPLNQRSSVGWKATHVAKRLVENYMLRIESGSKFSNTALKN